MTPSLTLLPPCLVSAPDPFAPTAILIKSWNQHKTLDIFLLFFFQFLYICAAKCIVLITSSSPTNLGGSVYGDNAVISVYFEVHHCADLLHKKNCILYYLFSYGWRALTFLIDKWHSYILRVTSVKQKRKSIGPIPIRHVS